MSRGLAIVLTVLLVVGPTPFARGWGWTRSCCPSPCDPCAVVSWTVDASASACAPACAPSSPSTASAETLPTGEAVSPEASDADAGVAEAPSATGQANSAPPEVAPTDSGSTQDEGVVDGASTEQPAEGATTEPPPVPAESVEATPEVTAPAETGTPFEPEDPAEAETQLLPTGAETTGEATPFPAEPPADVETSTPGAEATAPVAQPTPVEPAEVPDTAPTTPQPQATPDEEEDLFDFGSVRRVLDEPGGLTSEDTRTWSDAGGAHSCVARLSAVSVDGIVLERADGGEARVAFRMLSDTDLQFVRRQIRARQAELGAHENAVIAQRTP